MNQREKRDEFDAQATTYLTRLTKAQTIDDLLQVVRDAVAWGLKCHLEEIAERKRAFGS